VGQLDGRATEELDKTEGKIRSEGNKSGDVRTVAEGAAGGASVGAIAGSVAGHAGMGAGVGAAAGAAAGLAGVLLSRGPEAVLAKGTTMEMVLDRPIRFEENELDTSSAGRRALGEGSGPLPSKHGQGASPTSRRFPY
jgi:type IV secretion system protein VirB10